MRRVAVLALWGILLTGCGDEGNPIVAPDTGPKLESEFPAQGASGVTVITRNLYVGADINPILGAPSLPAIPGLVAAAFEQVQATDFPERAEALADEISATEPHLVGLQEVSLIRIQSPGDFFIGNPVPATDVAFDYLAILLDALEARGLDYAAVAVSHGVDVELPSATGDDIRLTDREVILARGDVDISNVEEENFAVNLTIQVGGPGGPPLTILRGWVGVDATINHRTIRFVSTHLEPASIPPIVPIQVAQANELIGVLAGVALPIIFVGDFNSAADGSTTPTYGILIDAGFVDAWSEARPRDPGFTCCQEPDLLNPTSVLDERIDLILVRDDFEQDNGIVGGVHVGVLGEEQGDRTPSGLWPSDHAGVLATLRLPPRQLP